MRVVRVWIQGYNGVVAVVSVGAASLLIAAFARETVPSFGHTAIPVGMLTPPLLAALASLGCSTRLPSRGAVPLRVMGARLLWGLVLTWLSMMGAWLVGDVYPGSGLPGATAVLTAITFGATTVLGRGAMAVGGLAAVVVLLNLSSFAQVREESWSLGPLADAFALFAAGIAIVLFAVFGSSADNPFPR